VHIQEVKDAGYFNKDFASAKLNDGVKAVATGAAAHYPQLGGTAANIENVAPGKSKDVGFFALPGDDASKNGLTVWPGTAAMYIPKSVEGDKLDAAKKLIEFAATQQGCDAYIKGNPPPGPFLSKACQLPAEVSQVATDTQAYFESGKAGPALEFVSPVKGPRPGADLHPGGHRSGRRQEGRGTLRPGRQEASPATRLAGLGVRLAP
jgi:raffinose/stachyose/melibiose transport system substrate-binding protein